MSINVFGASRFLEADAGVRTPFEGICLLDPRVVFGYKPDSLGHVLLVPTRAASPGPLTVEILPSGAVSSVHRTAGWSGEIHWDDTSKSSALRGGEACGGVSLSIISGGRSPMMMTHEGDHGPD